MDEVAINLIMKFLCHFNILRFMILFIWKRKLQMKIIGIITGALLVCSTAVAGPSADGPAGFTTDWHGHGANHQGNNNPGDTASDRHNFTNATAGKSGHNPTDGSRQAND